VIHRRLRLGLEGGGEGGNESAEPDHRRQPGEDEIKQKTEMERCGRLTMMTCRLFGVAASTVSGFPVRLGLMVPFLTDRSDLFL
jgi:hypothetical protein